MLRKLYSLDLILPQIHRFYVLDVYKKHRLFFDTLSYHLILESCLLEFAVCSSIVIFVKNIAMTELKNASEIIKHAKFVTVFTGAGISKESGIPVFRGGDGVYTKYDHSLLEIRNYKKKTKESWEAVKAIFYDVFDVAEPNKAHFILADWEREGIVKHIITQNIDNLHQEGGSKSVIEYHGNKDSFVCFECGKSFRQKELELSLDPPKCLKCEGLLKPDFVFFGEPIPTDAARLAHDMAKSSDVHIIIGTTGEVQPASYIPYYAKKAGAIIIEINPEESRFTDSITDIFIKLKATEALGRLDELIKSIL